MKKKVYKTNSILVPNNNASHKGYGRESVTDTTGGLHVVFCPSFATPAITSSSTVRHKNVNSYRNFIGFIFNYIVCVVTQVTNAG